MSTDPRTNEGPEEAGDVAAPARWEGTAGRSPGTSHSSIGAGSGTVARLLTILYALVVTPLGTSLLVYGGINWMRYTMSRGIQSQPLLDFLASPPGTRVVLGVGAGVLLLVSVVASGIFSSAGLLVVGAMSVVSVVLSVAPGLLNSLHVALPKELAVVVLDAFSYGVPLVLHPVMGGLGLGLVIARRRPDPHLAVALVGIVLLPLVMLLAAWLTLRGLADGAVHNAATFYSEPLPVSVIVMIVLGALLLSLSAAAARWSPYSLVIPGLVVLGFSLAIVMPDVLLLLPDLWFTRTGGLALTVLSVGGGPAIGAVLLAHALVLAVVRVRARRRRLLLEA